MQNNIVGSKSLFYLCPLKKIEWRICLKDTQEKIKHNKMSKVCILTGKRVRSGNSVSHSNQKTKRKFYPNLQVKKFFIPETGEWISLKLSTSAIKTINKNGITASINKYLKKGKI